MSKLVEAEEKKVWKRIKEKLPFRSLQMRLFVIVLVVGILPSIFMRFAILRTYTDRAVDYRAATVSNQLMIVANHLISNNYFSEDYRNNPDYTASNRVINAELEMLSNLYEGRVMIIGNNFKVRKDTYSISEGKTMISEEVIRCFRGENVTHYDSEHGYIEMTIPIVQKGTEDTPDRIVGVMLTSVSDSYVVATIDIMGQKAAILQAIMLVLVFALALLLSRASAKPLNRVTEEIKKVKDGLSNECISVGGYSETSHIVNAFNEMLAKTTALDDSRQEFVANVSHELKTPMTSLKVLADSLLMQEEVPAELYKEFMQDMVSEIDRENQIINDLLALVKMDKSVRTMNVASVNINDLTELILKRLRPIARKKDVEVIFESNRSVVAEVDEVKMSLILTNLVENAIKYNKDHGSVKVLLDADHQFFTISVTDTGIGIPEDAMAHIYERFYRVDKSHSREIGGTGLGLAITKNAVMLHKGSITLNSVYGEGTTFVVKIPLNYIG